MNPQLGISLILWLIIGGGVGALIGRRKKREFAGFVWGFLLGPIGWIIIAAGPNLGPKCPECGGDVVEGARRCKNCGAALEVNGGVMSTDDMQFPDNPFGGKSS